MVNVAAGFAAQAYPFLHSSANLRLRCPGTIRAIEVRHRVNHAKLLSHAQYSKSVLLEPSHAEPIVGLRSVSHTHRRRVCYEDVGPEATSSPQVHRVATQGQAYCTISSLRCLCVETAVRRKGSLVPASASCCLGSFIPVLHGFGTDRFREGTWPPRTPWTSRTRARSCTRWTGELALMTVRVRSH